MDQVDFGLLCDFNKVSQCIFPPKESCVYTPCYCEENVWKLCDHVRANNPEELKRCFVVFISNKDRQIPLWQQRASKELDTLVIWDYHVLLIYKGEGGSIVYDLDTILPFPCRFTTYLEYAIDKDSLLKPEFHRMFRLIPAAEYLKEFASDRSHMTDENGSWKAEPPNYPCIQSEVGKNNLEDFISMDEETGFGKVVNLEGLMAAFS